jgi:hypothetical protein
VTWPSFSSKLTGFVGEAGLPQMGHVFFKASSRTRKKAEADGLVTVGELLGHLCRTLYLCPKLQS